MPGAETFDDPLLDAMCDRLKKVLYAKGTYIVREGDPIDEMLFIVRGKLETISTHGGFFTTNFLNGGDFFGEELLPRSLEAQSSSLHPISTRTVRAITEVEAFALLAHDLKSLLSYHVHVWNPPCIKQLVQSLRFCSEKWSTWAACFIQAAWRRFLKRKRNVAIREAEDRLREAVGTLTTPAAANYASRFAINMLRVLSRNGGSQAGLPQRSWSPLPPKPTDLQLTL